jgi:hypothetical protein
MLKNVKHSPNHHEDGDVLLTLFSLEGHSFLIVSIILLLGYRLHLCTSVTLSDKLTAAYT